MSRSWIDDDDDFTMDRSMLGWAVVFFVLSIGILAMMPPTDAGWFAAFGYTGMFVAFLFLVKGVRE